MSKSINWEYSKDGMHIVGLSVNMRVNVPFKISFINNHLLLQYGMVSIHSVDLSKYLDDDSEVYSNGSPDTEKLLLAQEAMFDYAEKFLKSHMGKV